jgi:transcriptional regulator with XRE-family HTH domain
MGFAETMRRLRAETGLTQAALAERSGIPLRTIQGWEQGYRCPVSPAFFQLTKALGVSCAAFAECEGVQADGDEPVTKPGARKGAGKPLAKARGKRTR